MTVCGGNLPEEYNLAKVKPEVLDADVNLMVAALNEANERTAFLAEAAKIADII